MFVLEFLLVKKWIVCLACEPLTCFSSFFCKWNSHGYDISKIFGNKFTLISPVWLQVRRKGKERFQFTGLHDADKGFLLFSLNMHYKYDCCSCCGPMCSSVIYVCGLFSLCLMVKYFNPLNFWKVSMRMSSFLFSPASTNAHSFCPNNKKD